MNPHFAIEFSGYFADCLDEYPSGGAWEVYIYFFNYVNPCGETKYRAGDVPDDLSILKMV